jgi:hypothetical protein
MKYKTVQTWTVEGRDYAGFGWALNAALKTGAEIRFHSEFSTSLDDGKTWALYEVKDETKMKKEVA